MTNKSIASLLSETATLVEIAGGNAFRARAFQRAARTLEQLDESVATLLAEDRLTDISGIGAGLAAQIGELVDRGSFEARDDLLASLPPGLLDLTRVRGLGPKRIRQIWQELDVTTLDALEDAAQSGRLAELDGFGPKTQQNVLESLDQLRAYAGRRRYAEAVGLVEPILAALREADVIVRAEPSGPLRRQMETVAGADLLVATTTPKAVRAVAADLGLALTPRPDGDDLVFTGTVDDDFPLRLRIVAPERFGTAWWWQTGSSEHCAAFEERYGAPAAVADEPDLYATVDLEVVPPALREGRNELEAAARHALPDLITTESLHGTLHNHSTYSDGAHSLREMAEAARARGYSYFGICDHSQSLQIANGLSVDAVQEQQAEVRALNETFADDGGPPFRIFSGIESDILPDGSLDYDDDILASFDFIVASVHTRFSMSTDEATARIIRAVRNPYTTILGHPTGRLLLRRDGYAIHHEPVIEACAEHGVAIELNANPYRLDLDWRWIRAATEQGVLIAINPDAHSIDQLDYMRWGVRAAQKGWLTAEQCLNAKPLDAFSGWLAHRRASTTV
ncbi:MAG: DNA polymerase/3'-5' exonuclease PolX [Bacteroidetes bacterium]|jgi:DNA polymerase (family 10)|nr:DNA polymerase/3'-5' exonuclease PolX [Bacteroidota bacterium]